MRERITNRFRSALPVLGACCVTVLAGASEITGKEPTEPAPDPRRSYEAPAGMPTPATAETSKPGSPPQSKIRFDLDRLNAEGLQGPPNGLRALHYEYCIPDRPDALRDAAAIDPTLETQRGSRGRVGCGPAEVLCLGHTHQPDYREILRRLAELSIVSEIRECFFE